MDKIEARCGRLVVNGSVSLTTTNNTLLVNNVPVNAPRSMTVSSATTLTAGDNGKIIFVDSSGGFNIYLPKISEVPAGWTIDIILTQDLASNIKVMLDSDDGYNLQGYMINVTNYQHSLQGVGFYGGEVPHQGDRIRVTLDGSSNGYFSGFVRFPEGVFFDD